MRQPPQTESLYPTAEKIKRQESQRGKSDITKKTDNSSGQPTDWMKKRIVDEANQMKQKEYERGGRDGEVEIAYEL